MKTNRILITILPHYAKELYKTGKMRLFRVIGGANYDMRFKVKDKDMKKQILEKARLLKIANLEARIAKLKGTKVSPAQKRTYTKRALCLDCNKRFKKLSLHRRIVHDKTLKSNLPTKVRLGII